MKNLFITKYKIVNEDKYNQIKIIKVILFKADLNELFVMINIIFKI